MKRNKFLRILVLVLVMPALLITACKEEIEQQEANVQKQTYICSMHPQIVQDKPGTCPICGMDLVAFDKTNADASLTLNESQIVLANVTTMIVGSNILSNYRQLNGRLATDPSKTTFVSSRVPGRIEVLYVKQAGERVSRGQPLYKIYSEQLAALQQEYLLAVAQAKEFPADQRFQQIEKAARQKLVLYDQNEAQLQRLVSSGTTESFITYTAKSSGTVAELSVTEGQYVPEGGNIMRLEGYNELWVEADVYPTEASNISVGQSVKVVIPGWEDQPQNMTVQFISPSFQSGSQLTQVRGTITNRDNQWQAGLQANILLPVRSKSTVLTLPADAVIRDGKGTHVWMQTAMGKFEPRMVKTGMENFESVEITEGLQKGDTVVVTGAYLLNSEYILKKGADPMAAHSH